MAPASVQEPNPQPVKSDWTAKFREIITAIISLAIAAIALFMLWNIYWAATKTPFDEQAYGRQNDILLFVLGFFGTVTGYYLGHVPAERQADAARESATISRNSEQRLRQQVRAGLAAIEEGNAAGGGAAAGNVDRAVEQLRALLWRFMPAEFNPIKEAGSGS
jgi:hypothetical protein